VFAKVHPTEKKSLLGSRPELQPVKEGANDVEVIRGYLSEAIEY
jgi:hypothetical protein